MNEDKSNLTQTWPGTKVIWRGDIDEPVLGIVMYKNIPIFATSKAVYQIGEEPTLRITVLGKA